ncbi:MAG: hypothetical protein KKD11_00350 [Candidatus Omnitrophica bacterium]|nr:hypothetical protein [Candidatus Omnitrophota bacterium]
MYIRTLFKKIIAYAFLATFAFFPVQVLVDETEKWFPFYIPWNYCEGSQLDFSFLLDAPAGNHGFLTTKDGHFYFEDGTRARFWGLNIHSSRACFPTRAQAEDIARRLAQLGCNIVRMHFLDLEAPRGVVDGEYSDSQHLSASQMDKLDYFIYQLKQNGIYTCFDVLGLGARNFKPGDGLPEADDIRNGAGGVSFFNKRIIELSKKFALDFLTHVNPYTKNAYLDEPAIALVEMTNENSLFLKHLYDKFPPYYNKEIQDMWEGWLADRTRDLKPVKGGWKEDKEFLFELQDTYQREMYNCLRFIGVKIPIGASNLPYDSLALLADSRMDFVDMHIYWDLCDTLDKIHNRALIKQDHLNPMTIVNTIAIAKVGKKPLISTEWGSNWPNEWRAVDILTTAAYAGLNDWDALFLYSYNGGWGLTWENLEKKLYFGTVIFNDPAKMGLFSLASLMFLRKDVDKASSVHTAAYPIEKLFEMHDSWQDRSKLAGIAYLSRIEKEFHTNENKKIEREISYPEVRDLIGGDGRLISDTGEIIRDFKKGIFILKTPRTFSFSGFISEEKDQEFKGIRFSSGTDFSTFTITSLDSQDIDASRHLLLVVVGRVQNRGQKLAPHITKKDEDLHRDVYVLKTGQAPILVEDIKGTVCIKKVIRQKGLRVFSLDEKGRRKKEIPISLIDSEYSFGVSGEHQTIYYEVLRI